MRFTVAIVAENNPVIPAGVDAPGYRLRVPAIDLREHGFHLRIAQLILRIPPIERAQWLIERVVGSLAFAIRRKAS